MAYKATMSSLLFHFLYNIEINNEICPQLKVGLKVCKRLSLFKWQPGNSFDFSVIKNSFETCVMFCLLMMMNERDDYSISREAALTATRLEINMFRQRQWDCGWLNIFLLVWCTFIVFFSFDLPLHELLMRNFREISDKAQIKPIQSPLTCIESCNLISILNKHENRMMVAWKPLNNYKHSHNLFISRQ